MINRIEQTGRIWLARKTTIPTETELESTRRVANLIRVWQCHLVIERASVACFPEDRHKKTARQFAELLGI